MRVYVYGAYLLYTLYGIPRIREFGLDRDFSFRFHRLYVIAGRTRILCLQLGRNVFGSHNIIIMYYTTASHL